MRALGDGPPAPATTRPGRPHPLRPPVRRRCSSRASRSQRATHSYGARATAPPCAVSLSPKAPSSWAFRAAGSCRRARAPDCAPSATPWPPPVETAVVGAPTQGLVGGEGEGARALPCRADPPPSPTPRYRRRWPTPCWPPPCASTRPRRPRPCRPRPRRATTTPTTSTRSGASSAASRSAWTPSRPRRPRSRATRARTRVTGAQTRRATLAEKPSGEAAEGPAFSLYLLL